MCAKCAATVDSIHTDEHLEHCGLGRSELMPGYFDPWKVDGAGARVVRKEIEDEA